MAKYFKLNEISEEEFINNTGGELDCLQIVDPVGENVFIAIDDEELSELSIPLDILQ